MKLSTIKKNVRQKESKQGSSATYKTRVVFFATIALNETLN